MSQRLGPAVAERGRGHQFVKCVKQADVVAAMAIEPALLLRPRHVLIDEDGVAIGINHHQAGRPGA